MKILYHFVGAGERTPAYVPPLAGLRPGKQIPPSAKKVGIQTCFGWEESLIKMLYPTYSNLYAKNYNVGFILN